MILAQMEEKFAAIAEVHHEVKLRIRLKRIVKLNNKRTLNFLQDHSLSYPKV